MKTATALLLAIACQALVACNVIEGLHQTSPNYRKAVPFSDKWYSDRETEKRKQGL